MLVVEMITFIFEQETMSYVQIVIEMLEICGKKMMAVHEKWINEIFDKLRNILNDEQLDEVVS